MKIISLVSGGIDSPVATYLIGYYVDEIILLHADVTPFLETTDREVFLSIAKQLKTVTPCSMKTYIIPHSESLKVFQRHCDKRYTCVFCKRMLLRYAEVIAKKEGCSAILMGDSLGQVASQTLHNLLVID